MPKKNYTAIANAFIKEGYNVIPIGYNKVPAIGNWMNYQKRTMTEDEVKKYFKDCSGIAMLCGGKWRVFCIDIDCKVSLDGQLFERVKEAVPNRILRKCYVQSTINNGYHLVFKVPATKLNGNEKLASRYATPEEKHQTYIEHYNNPKTRDKALKIAMNDATKCLVETRSGTSIDAGGYFLIAPTPNYKPIYGKIGELTEDEYEELIAAIRSLNEVRELEPRQKYQYDAEWEKTPFEHFNEVGDILGILEENGWEVEKGKGKNYRVKRPGKTSSKSSGMVDTGMNVLYVFSSGSIFECNKGYNAVGVLSILNFEGDLTQVYKYLVENGFGIKK